MADMTTAEHDDLKARIAEGQELVEQANLQIVKAELAKGLIGAAYEENSAEAIEWRGKADAQIAEANFVKVIVGGVLEALREERDSAEITDAA